MVSRTRVLTLIRIFLLIFMIVATGVGIGGHIIEDKDNDEVYVSLWEFKDANGVYTETNRLGCETLKNRLNGIAGISIIALVFYFFMLIIAIIDLIKNHINLARAIIFNVLNFIAFVFIMTSWAAEGHFYHSDWCAGFNPIDQNFGIGYGLALLVVVWVVQIVMTIIWIVTKILDPKPEAKDTVTTNEPTTEDEEAARKRKEQRRAERRAKADAEAVSANTEEPKTVPDSV